MLVATTYVEVKMPRGFLKDNHKGASRAMELLNKGAPEYVIAGHGSEFNRTQVIAHGRTCFLLDIGHDWSYSSESKRFKLHVETESVVLVFKTKEVLFCPHCGVVQGYCNHI